MLPFHQQFLNSYSAMLRRRHGFGSTHLAIMCVMATDRKRVFGRAEMARILEMSEINTRNAMRRLDLEQFTERGRLLPYGEALVGLRDFPFRFSAIEVPPEAAAEA